MAHGSPRPRNTFTEFEPVTFPIAESAYSDYLAAVIEAKVSGSDVPRATMVIAVTDCSIPRTHPRTLAISPTTPVTIPIIARDTKKAAFPFQILLGGTRAKKTFQKIVKKWYAASDALTSSRIRSS